MIVLNLQCGNAHPFEGWFDSIEDFDRQSEAVLVTCPICGDKTVLRLPSGPRVKRAVEAAVPAQQALHAMQALAEMAKNSEDVADHFPEEVRRMHYGETKQRNVRGHATLQETRELLEEGIAVLPLPLPAKDDLH